MTAYDNSNKRLAINFCQSYRTRDESEIQDGKIMYSTCSYSTVKLWQVIF